MNININQIHKSYCFPLPLLPNAPKKITVTVIGTITRTLRDLRR